MSLKGFGFPHLDSDVPPNVSPSLSKLNLRSKTFKKWKKTKKKKNKKKKKQTNKQTKILLLFFVFLRY